MHFHILTLFPEMVTGTLNTSITGRAMEKGLIRVDAVNIRDYTRNKHKKVDDYPYGGGAGMLMQAQPVYDAWKAVEEEIRHRKNKADEDQTDEKPKTRVIFLTPQGTTFHQQMAKELAKQSGHFALSGSCC